MKYVFHTNTLAIIAEFDLDDTLANPPIWNKMAIRKESLEIGDRTQISGDCHCTNAKWRCALHKRRGVCHCNGEVV